MAKYLKSLFQSSEKNRTTLYEAEMEDGEPPMDSRRKLSISRSGRLKQANKKRHSLSMDLYGENYQQVEKPKSVEYHVNSPVKVEAKPEGGRQRIVGDKQIEAQRSYLPSSLEPQSVDRRPSTETKILETEIDIAFEIIDKT